MYLVRLAWLPGKFCGEILRHKSELNHPLHPLCFIGVEDSVEHTKVVHRVPLRVLTVDVGGTPLELRRSIPRGQQVMRTNENGHRAQVVQFTKQGSTLRCRRIVRFVVAKPAVHGTIQPDVSAEINMDLRNGRDSLRMSGNGEHEEKA